jgi:hypothetical protein
MIFRRLVLRFVPLLVLGTFVVSCGTVTPDAGLQSSLLPTKTPLPTLPTKTPPPTRTPTPIPTREPVQLVVLHTNDNWGETEPCG